MKSIWAITMIVLAVTTDANPSTKGTPLRLRRYAFMGSPPSMAVGVVTFMASPAIRTMNS